MYVYIYIYILVGLIIRFINNDMHYNLFIPLYPPSSMSRTLVAEILAATREATAVDGEKKTRGKKEPFRVDFEAEVDVDSHLKKTRAATTVTKATLVKYSKSQTTLPKDLHYDGEKLFKMSLRPRLMVRDSYGSLPYPYMLKVYCSIIKLTLVLIIIIIYLFGIAPHP